MQEPAEKTAKTCHQRIIRETVGVHPMEVPAFGSVIEILPGGLSFGRIPLKVGREFITKYEWLGHAGRALIFYGTWKTEGGRSLVYGVEAFCPAPYGLAKALKETGKKMLYLARGACAWEAGPNGASTLIGACLRDLRRRGVPLVVAFSDVRAGESGGAYRAANAVYGGKTTSRHAYYFVEGRWITDHTLWRSYKKKVSDLPKDTLRKMDAVSKLRWYWVLHKSARRDIPSYWYDQIFVKSELR